MTAETRKNLRFVTMFVAIWVAIDVLRVGIEKITCPMLLVALLKGLISGLGAVGLLYLILWGWKKMSRS